MLFENKYRIETTRLKNWDYSSNGYYYITICTKNRECLFGNIAGEKMQLSTIGEIVLQCWNDSFVMRKELSCDQFVIMPNHIHGIVIIEKLVETHGNASGHGIETQGLASLQDNNKPHRMPKSVSSFIGGFKSAVTKRVNEIRHTPGAAIWQNRFYDHIIRDEKSLQRIREYIVNNPMNWQTDEQNRNP
jgi:REP element-mobilizing transposase RayT